jgi:hypothetical protein
MKMEVNFMKYWEISLTSSVLMAVMGTPGRTGLPFDAEG